MHMLGKEWYLPWYLPKHGQAVKTTVGDGDRELLEINMGRLMGIDESRLPPKKFDSLPERA